MDECLQFKFRTIVIGFYSSVGFAATFPAREGFGFAYLCRPSATLGGSRAISAKQTPKIARRSFPAACSYKFAKNVRSAAKGTMIANS